MTSGSLSASRTHSPQLYSDEELIFQTASDRSEGMNAVVRACDHVMRSKALIERLKELLKNFPKHEIQGDRPRQKLLNEAFAMRGQSPAGPTEIWRQLGEAR